MENELVQFLSTYGYVALVPILIVEGPLIGFLAGILSAAGIFNPYVVFALFVISDVISDSFLFFTARTSPALLEKFEPGRKAIARAQNHPAGQKTSEYARFVSEHFIKITLMLKLSPFPYIYNVMLITASLAGLSIKRFYLMVVTVLPLRSAVVVAFGYFVGSSIQDVELLLSTLGIVVIILVILSISYFRFVHPYLVENTRLGILMNGRNDEGGKD